jgi:hypothetical protein
MTCRPNWSFALQGFLLALAGSQQHNGFTSDTCKTQQSKPLKTMATQWDN